MNALHGALEVSAEIDEQRNIHISGPLPIAGPRRVRLIILFDDGSDVDEQEWLHAAARNPAFAFMAEEGEDLYSLADGWPLDDAR